MTTTTNQPTQAQWDAANRFLDRLFIDPILANGYQQISQQANGQDNAPEILTTWLQEKGYDTTPDLVYAALINLQNTSLTYWTGIYGQSFLGSNESAPVLAIGPDIAGKTVAYLDGVELKNFVFESVETDDVFHPTLSWDLDSNQTAGNITFYYTPAVTLDPEPPTGYTGNWFEGSLQTSVSSVSQKYYGAIGEPTDSSAIPKLILADGKEESWWDKYSTYVYIAIGVGIGVPAIIIVGVWVYRKCNVPEDNFEEQEPKKTATEWENEWKNATQDDQDTFPDYTAAMDKVNESLANNPVTNEIYWKLVLKEKSRQKTLRDLDQEAQHILTNRNLDKKITREELKRLEDISNHVIYCGGHGGYIEDLDRLNFEPKRPTGPSLQPTVPKISPKEIKQQKELFSQLDLESLNRIAETNLSSESKPKEIAPVIENVINTIYQSQDSYIIEDWNQLIEKGKKNKYFDDSAKKFRYFDNNPTRNKQGEVMGKLINNTWYDQSYLDWQRCRNNWLQEVHQVFVDAQPNNLEQKKFNDSKAPEQKKPLDLKNQGKPGGNTQKISGSKEVASKNQPKQPLDPKVSDSSKQPDNQKDSTEEKGSKKKTEEHEHRVFEK